jgi:hypothetical protein
VHAGISLSSIAAAMVGTAEAATNGARKSIIVAKVNVGLVMMLVPMVAPISVRGGRTVTVRSIAARVPCGANSAIRAPCRKKYCVNHGKMSDSGRFAVQTRDPESRNLLVSFS